MFHAQFCGNVLCELVDVRCDVNDMGIVQTFICIYCRMAQHEKAVTESIYRGRMCMLIRTHRHNHTQL